MADEVLDSWEDMIDENGVLEHKLNDLRVNDTKQEMMSSMGPIVANNCNPSVPSTQDSVMWPSMPSNDSNYRVNDNLNSFKILKRPVNMDRNRDSVCTSGNDSNQNQTIITLEDNTRTQYVPQVRILKRPNANSKDTSDQTLTSNRKSTNGNKSQTNNKTYEEREAEYAKARLRILGSASAPEEDTTSTQSTSMAATSGAAASSGTKTKTSPESRSTKLGLLNNTNELNTVPIIRLPLGPDGTKGFSGHSLHSPQHR